MNTIALQSTVRRVLVEKRQGFDLEAQSLKRDLEKCYKVTTIKKNKGFYVFKCQIHWQIEIFLLKL